MRKTVTMMMTLLMLASVLVNIGGFELREIEIDESSGRSGAEANLTTILSPRATVTDPMDGSKRGAILAGEDTQFDIVVLNEGDANITEMNIVVTIFLSGGNVAKDVNGNDLTWTDSVICDDLNACEYESLEPNTYLAGGAYTVQMFDANTMTREDVSWTPIIGDYEIVVQLEIPESNQDSVTSNNELLQPVSVVDWFDIEVDLAWQNDDGTLTDNAATGIEDKTFVLTVSLNGSSNWDARNVSILLGASGDGMSSATGSDGADIAAGHSVMAGTLNASAIVWQNMSDQANASSPGFQQFGERFELNWGDTFTYTGTLEVDSGVQSGTYKVTAALANYKVFAQKGECAAEEDVIIDNGPDGVAGTEDDIKDTMTVIHMCDDGESVADDVNANSEDEINGAVQNFHDIAVLDITVLQGYDEAGNNPAYFFKDGDTVSVGYSRIHVEVGHRGSDMAESYDWTVDIEVEDFEGNVVATYNADSCAEGMPIGFPPYSHKPLSINVGEDLYGFACPAHDFGNGEFTVTATVSMVNGPATGDMAQSNDYVVADFVAFNNVPTVSMALETTGDTVVGDLVSFTLSAFDADCPGGDCISFNWSRMTSTGQVDDMNKCDSDPLVPGSGWACADMAGPDWTGSNAVWVIATDNIGGESAASYAFPHVWNVIVIEQSTPTVDMSYNITTDMLTMMSYTLTDLDQMTGQSFAGVSGTFDSVWAVDYSADLSYVPENVLTQSMSVVFAGDSTADYTLWYKASSTWAPLSSVVDSYNSTHVMMNASSLAGGTLSSGTLAVFEGAEAAPPPSASVSSFNAAAAGMGAIELTWEVSGTMTSIDSYKVSVDGAEVASLAYDADRVWRDTGLDHGATHTYGVEICNLYGCNSVTGSMEATADNEVSPASGAGGVAFSEDGNNIVVTWTATDTSDVDHWMVCHDAATFDMNAVSLNQVTCDMTTGTEMTHTISKKTAAGTHNLYVSVGGMDTLGNMEMSGQMGNTQYTYEQDLTIDTDSTVGAAGDETLPSWAWPAIIAVVVIAFVAGAFILSRGGEDGDGGKDWDY